MTRENTQNNRIEYCIADFNFAHHKNANIAQYIYLVPRPGTRSITHTILSPECNVALPRSY